MEESNNNVELEYVSCSSAQYGFTFRVRQRTGCILQSRTGNELFKGGHFRAAAMQLNSLTVNYTCVN